MTIEIVYITDMTDEEVNELLLTKEEFDGSI